MTDWYAVHTNPRREQAAATELQRLGYFTFYPFMRKRIYVGRRRFPRDVDEPLFSRYIFVAFRGNPHESIGAVNSTFGVSTVVYLGGQPLVVPPRVIDSLMAITDDGDQVNLARLAQYTKQKVEHWFKGKPGDQVQMTDDAPYFGLIATLASVESIDKRGEISIWLRVLGAERLVDVKARAVAAVISRDGSKPVPHGADVAGGGRLARA